MTEPKSTVRDQRKAARRAQLLDAAATLFGERGFTSVRLEDLGSAAGISGPALYRHFPNKEAVLVELLVGISQYLLDGARAVLARADDNRAAIDELITFHLDFAFTSPALIRIQDRDLYNLPDAERTAVRRMQREYVEVWVSVLRGLTESLSESDARTQAHALFGLMNSTPHSTGRSPSKQARLLLREMTTGALGLR